MRFACDSVLRHAQEHQLGLFGHKEDCQDAFPQTTPAPSGSEDGWSKRF